jgi:ADP-ribose pyrophosphatase
VRHPGASAVMAFLDDAQLEDPRVLLIKQFRHAAGGFLLEIPAGRLESGESPLECAARELKEETGWTARSLEHVLTMYTTPGFTDERIHLFVASGLEPGEPAREKDEVLDIVMMPMSTAVEMISSGEIEDAKTAVAILFLDRIRRKC